MDLDLKAFSLTLAIGLSVAVVIYATVYVVRPDRAESLKGILFGEDGKPQVLPTVIAAVGLLAVGIICEDLSKNALSLREPVAFGPQLRAILPTETDERCDALLDIRPDGKLGCLDFNFDSDQLAPVRLGRLGNGIWNTLKERNRTATASPDEILVIRSWQKLLQEGSCPPDPHSGAVSDDVVCGHFSEGLRELFTQVYYLAKNVDYANPNFFKELEALRVRYDFERSLVFVLLAGIYFVSFAYLAESTRAMWGDVGGWKTGISLLLLLLLIVAAIDIVTSRDWLDAFACAREAACVRRLGALRSWLLPCSLLFVCAYRTRRVWKRAALRIAHLFTSTIPLPSTAPLSREVEAWRALKVIVILIVALVPADFAYRSDQPNYLNRVYGYYQSARGASLNCNLDSDCKSGSENVKPETGK